MKVKYQWTTVLNLHYDVLLWFCKVCAFIFLCKLIHKKNSHFSMQKCNFHYLSLTGKKMYIFNSTFFLFTLYSFSLYGKTLYFVKTCLDYFVKMFTSIIFLIFRLAFIFKIGHMFLVMSTKLNLLQTSMK